MASKCKSISVVSDVDRPSHEFMRPDLGSRWRRSPPTHPRQHANQRAGSKQVRVGREPQGENPSDQAITQQIRRAVLHDKSLSTYAPQREDRHKGWKCHPERAGAIDPREESWKRRRSLLLAKTGSAASCRSRRIEGLPIEECQDGNHGSNRTSSDRCSPHSKSLQRNDYLIFGDNRSPHGFIPPPRPANGTWVWRKWSWRWMTPGGFAKDSAICSIPPRASRFAGKPEMGARGLRKQNGCSRT